MIETALVLVVFSVQHRPLSMALSILPLALVDNSPPIWEDPIHAANTVHSIVNKLTFVRLARGPTHHANPTHDIILPLAAVDTAISPDNSALAMSEAPLYVAIVVMPVPRIVLVIKYSRPAFIR